MNKYVNLCIRIFNSSLFNNEKVYTMEFRRSLMSLLVLGATHSAMSMEPQEPAQKTDKEDKKVLSFIVDHNHIIQKYVKNEIDFFDAKAMVVEANMFNVLPLNEQDRKAIEQACTEAANNQQSVKVLCDVTNKETQEVKKFAARVSAFENTVLGAEDKTYQYTVQFSEKQAK